MSLKITALINTVPSVNILYHTLTLGMIKRTRYRDTIIRHNIVPKIIFDNKITMKSKEFDDVSHIIDNTEETYFMIDIRKKYATSGTYFIINKSHDQYTCALLNNFIDLTNSFADKIYYDLTFKQGINIWIQIYPVPNILFSHKTTINLKDFGDTIYDADDIELNLSQINILKNNSSVLNRIFFVR